MIFNCWGVILAVIGMAPLIATPIGVALRLLPTLLAKIKPFERRLEEKRKKHFPLLKGVNDDSSIRV